MNEVIAFDKNYSTTRRVIKADPPNVAEQVKQTNKPEDKFETVLFLPQGEDRQGEGGLRTKGYFKKSYKEKPLISIVTVVYNGEQYLEETIQSVIHQTYDNVEYIIIDGGSSDGTLGIIKKYEDKIDYWVSEKDSGIYNAMNKGIRLANGDFMGLINSDDWYELDALKNVVNNRINGVLFGKMLSYFIDGTFYFHNPSIPLSKEKMKISSVHPTVFISRDCYKKYGLFNLEYKLSADYELLLRFYTEGVKFKKIQKLIANFRDGGASSNGAGRKESYLISKKYNFKLISVLRRKVSIMLLPIKKKISLFFPIVAQIKRKVLFRNKKTN